MSNKFHQFHMVSMSPWPLLTSMSMGAMAMKMGLSMLKWNTLMMIKMMWINMMIATLWWMDTIKESKKEGEHQKSVSKGLKLGMLMFIASELMFFFSFFWCYFHSSMSPTTEMGQAWPPEMVNSFNPINVPLLNTLILISSGVSVTWAHHNIMKNKMKKSSKSLMVTCMLGMYFSYLQYLEYNQAEFTMNDSSYGSIFFMATGFHGIHVIIGTVFLMASLWGIKKMSVTKNHHNSFEMAAWYWHFVDVVWLTLYLSVYWWGK